MPAFAGMTAVVGFKQGARKGRPYARHVSFAGATLVVALLQRAHRYGIRNDAVTILREASVGKAA
jgi:hypothetical protein